MNQIKWDYLSWDEIHNLTTTLPCGPSNQNEDLSECSYCNYTSFGCSKFGNTVRQFCSSATLQFGNMTYRQRYSSATPQFGNSAVRQMPIGNKPIGNSAYRQQYLSATLPIGNKPIGNSAYRQQY